jgi:hypothetical protein
MIHIMQFSPESSGRQLKIAAYCLWLAVNTQEAGNDTEVFKFGDHRIGHFSERRARIGRSKVQGLNETYGRGSRLP